MYTFTISDITENTLFDAYVHSITGINDDFWEGHVLDSQIYRVELSGQMIGLCGLYNQENLTLFYIQPGFLRHAQPAFNAMLDVLKPQYSFAPTNDELLISLCMDKQVKIEMQAYFWKHGGSIVRPAEYSRELLTLAVPSDEADIMAMEDEEDKAEVAERIAQGKYYVMRENGVYLGQGNFHKHTIIANAVSIGMAVHPDFRRKGVGRSIIMHLADICHENELMPYCGCWYYNHNSKATLESAGFVTQTRLLKVWF